MATLTIGNRDIEVGDEFLKLSPEQQAATVEEIAQSLGITGEDSQPAEAPKVEAPGPELTAGRAAGLTGRAAVQAAPTAALGLPAIAYDAVQGLAQLGYRGVDSLLGTELAQTHRGGNADPFATTNALGKTGEMAADGLGLTKPETPGERIATGALQTGAEAIGGAGLGRVIEKSVRGAAPVVSRFFEELADAPFTQGVIGALGGGGAQVAQENDVNPLVGAGVGLATGVGGASLVQGGRNAVPSINRALALGEETQQQLAAERLRAASSTPENTLRDLEDGAGAELVPGSKPTTFQSTGDLGIGALEREMQTANPEVFAQRRAEQNSARQSALRSVEGEGDANEFLGFIRHQLDDLDRMTEGQEKAARSNAESAADFIRLADDPESLGRKFRGSLKDNEDIARRKETALWNAVDPDGTLTATTQGAKEVAGALYGRMTQSAKLGMSNDEQAIVDLVRNFKPVESFAELKDLSSQIKALMRDEISRRGRTPSWARLAQLSQSVRSGMEKSAAQRIASDPSFDGRFRTYLDEWHPSSDTGAGADRGQTRAVRQGGFSGLAGEEAPQNWRTGPSASASGLSRPARQGRPLSLTQFIAKNGGLPLDAESAARDWGSVSVPGYGKLAHRNGRSIDGYWRTKLIEEGYLPPDADGYSSRDITKELHDAIENERAGRKTFTAQDNLRGPKSFSLDGYDAELDTASKQIREELQTVGVRPDEVSSRAVRDAADMLARGDEKDAITAYERAVMDLEDEGPVRAQYPTNDRPSAGSLLDGFRDDPQAGARYKAATEATRSRVGTFSKGYVGQILRLGDDKQSFRMSDASVTANVFKPGPTGGERVKAALKAGGSKADVADMAASSLHKFALRPDGTIDPAKFQRWRSTHADALKELPEDVRARFANANLASQAMERAAKARKDALNDFNKSVLGKVAKVDPADMTKTIGGILNSANSAKEMTKLVGAVSGNKSAREGLRRAVAETIVERFVSNKEVAASGENGLKADAFQSFVKKRGPALKLTLGADGHKQLQAIADDLQRAERSLQAIRIPGNSNTAQDLAGKFDELAKKAGGSVFQQIILAGAAGFMAGGPKGLALGAGGAYAKHTLGTMRAAGMKKVDDLVIEMLLNPSLAQAALLKTTPGNLAHADRHLANKLLRVSPFAVAGAVGGSNDL